LGERVSITFSNRREFNTFIAGVRESYHGWRERATLVSRITLADEVAIFYKKIWTREGGQELGIDELRMWVGSFEWRGER
jgi:hypothetical protein